MQVSYNWLKEFVDIDITPQELAERLTLAGVAVEKVAELGQGVEKIITGRIETVAPHPNADKLVVTSVNTGGETLQIITAATNVKEGDVIPVAVEGARLASGLVIKKAKLRGVESRGMMCSGQELGIDPKTMPGEQATGIMILPPDTPLGKDAKELLGLNDYILELDLTPNRGDCLSMAGVAREVAALLEKPFKLAIPAFPQLQEDIAGQVRIDIEAPDLCKRFVGRLLKNVRVGPSPLWMQQRLRSAGIRPISNIVDVTNYVMLELGQPMHAFDYDLLAQGHIIVRRAKDGEKIVSLDGKERALNSDMLAITDPSGPVAVAGVMGGLATEVTEKTVTVLLESAYFNPISVRRTSKALGLRSEASLRFEKGIDINGCDRAANRAVQLIVSMGAGEAVSGMVDNYESPVQEKTILLRPARAVHVLGVDISGEDTERILKRLHFKVQEAPEGLLVTVPTYRVDITQEIDLIEEVARIYGYDRVPATLPFGPTTQGIKTREQAIADKIQDILAYSGLHEVVTYSFTHPRVLDLMNLPGDSPFRNTAKIYNPLSEEHSIMRTMLLPGLLEVLSKNHNRRVQNGAIFEIGRVFYPGPADSQPEERPVLAAAAMGRTPANWNSSPREMDFYYLKGILEVMLSRLGAGPASFRLETGNPSFHPGRTAAVEVNGAKLGIIGELHPDVLDGYDLPDRVVAFELDLPLLISLSGKPAAYIPLPRFPGIERDMAIVVSRNTPSAEIFEAIRLAGGEILRSISLFDIYQGEQVPDGFRSMAFSLKFQANDRTLTDLDVSEKTSAIVDALSQRFQAELRS